MSVSIISNRIFGVTIFSNFVICYLIGLIFHLLQIKYTDVNLIQQRVSHCETPDVMSFFC
jgi:hypothetical protein